MNEYFSKNIEDSLAFLGVGEGPCRIKLNVKAFQDHALPVILKKNSRLRSLFVKTEKGKVILTGNSEKFVAGKIHLFSFDAKFWPGRIDDPKIHVHYRTKYKCLSSKLINIAIKIPPFRGHANHLFLSSLPASFSHSILGLHFDLSILLKQIPSVLGQMKLKAVRIEDETIDFYVRGNPIIRKIIELFGPQFVSVEAISAHDEALSQLLTGH